MQAQHRALQLERDKLNHFWLVEKKRLEDMKDTLRDRERELQDLEEQQQVRDVVAGFVGGRAVVRGLTMRRCAWLVAGRGQVVEAACQAPPFRAPERGDIGEDGYVCVWV